MVLLLKYWGSFLPNFSEKGYNPTDKELKTCALLFKILLLSYEGKYFLRHSSGVMRFSTQDV